MSTIAEILERAAARIEKPGAWTQHDYAHDAQGHGVDPCDPRAVSWCVLGACAAETEQGVWLRDEHFAEAIARALPGRRPRFVHPWNDARERTQAEVVAALREAARLAREAGR